MRRLLSLTALLSASAAVLAAQQRFTSRVDIVRVDVLVTSGGKPVPGLKAADFDVFDNNVRQQVDLVRYEELPVNAVLALDMSQSVSGEQIDHLRAAGHALLGALRPDDQAALIGFSHAVAVDSALTKNHALVGAALDRAAASGATSLLDACFSGIALTSTDAGRSLVIVFSDGLDSSSWLSEDEVLDAARRSDAVVYAFSSADVPASKFLPDLTTATGGELIRIASTTDLSARFLKVLAEFRQRYLISYTPRAVSKTGWHRLDVHVKRPDAKVKARPGYMAGMS